MQVELYSGADNRFLLVQASVEARGDWPAVARAWCAKPCFEGERPDGLLVLDTSGDAPRMIVLNADGSRPEACGNGLRCVAWHLLRGAAAPEVVVETDAGARRVRLVESAGDEARLFASMGTARIHALPSEFPAAARASSAHAVDVGNPHCVLRVDDERAADVDGLGAALQRSAEFPNGVNVGFLARRDDAWHLRVFERGVGETAACGTGACAAAATIANEPGETTIHMRGGPLVVRRRADGEVELFGPARRCGGLELEAPGD